MDHGRRPPLDLRKLASFVAVGERLHFGRAAEHLHISQPVLSRRVSQLELELGVQLLERSSHHVKLTPAGRRLLADGRQLLRNAEQVSLRLYAQSDEPGCLRVGFFVGDVVAPALRAFARLRPSVRLELRQINWDDQEAVLHDGRADVALVHLPVEEDGLELEYVRSEPRVVALYSSHRCARATGVEIAELAEDPLVRHGGASPAWEAFHCVDPRPDGRHPRPGPVVGNIDEKLQHVAAGEAIAFLPASAARVYAPAGVAFVTVNDIPPLDVYVAWVAEGHSPLVEDFAECMRGPNEPTRTGLRNVLEASSVPEEVLRGRAR